MSVRDTLRSVLRVMEHHAFVYRRTWQGSVFSTFLNPVLYLAAMGVGLGSLVDENMPGGVDGIPYLTFLAPGLLVATAIPRPTSSAGPTASSDWSKGATWNAAITAANTTETMSTRAPAHSTCPATRPRMPIGVASLAW